MAVLKEKKEYIPPELEAQTITVTDIVTESADGESVSMDGWGKWQF